MTDLGRLRIAHLTDCFAPRTGGIETQVAALASQQQSAGHDVRVITATRGLDDEACGVRVERITARVPMDLPLHPRTRDRVVTALRRDPVDVVHIHAGVVSPFAWGAARAARELRIPTLVTVHCVWGPLARPGFAASNAIVQWSNWGMQLAAVSEMAAAAVAQAVPGAQPVLVTPNGIDPVAWRMSPQPSEPDALRVVSVSRLAPRKRIEALIDIWAQADRRLARAGVLLRATMIGDGPLRPRAERRARRLGLDVAFHGRLSRSQILEQYARSDVFIQPSIRESFGLAALEARTAGLPVIARAQSGSTSFIEDGVDGVLASNDAAMVDALTLLGTSRDRLNTMAEHNRRVPPRQTWPNVLAEVDFGYAQAFARIVHAA